MARYDFPNEVWALINPLLLPELGVAKGERLPYLEHRAIEEWLLWDTLFRDALARLA